MLFANVSFRFVCMCVLCASVLCFMHMFLALLFGVIKDDSNDNVVL